MTEQKKLYQVQGGHSVRAAGKSHRGGTADDIVALAMVDAKRLMDAGVILPVDAVADAADPAAGNGAGEGAIDTWADTILAGNVGEVAEAISGLDADALQLLSETEAAGKNRKGVLEAITAELASGQE